jgi:hypothetical protein
MEALTVVSRIGATSVRSRIATFLREPLVHFLAIGAGFFVLWHFLGDRLTRQPERIVVTPGHVERIAQQWTKTHLRPPTAEELAGLVEQEIDEEILYREAVAMGLDRDDLVIRRRLAVKMEFVTDDVTAAAAPTDEQLQTFLSQHPDKFNLEALTTFAQVYINRSQRCAGASAEAERMLTLLNDKAGPDWQTRLVAGVVRWNRGTGYTWSWSASALPGAPRRSTRCATRS